MTIRHGLLKVGDKRGYLLSSDGTNSKVHTAPNIFAQPVPSWSAGAQFGGVYTTIREGNTNGQVLVYGPQNITFAPDACMLGPAWQATAMVTYDFATDGQLGWTAAGFHGETHFINGCGWAKQAVGGAPNEIRIYLNMGSYVDLRWIEIFFTVNSGSTTRSCFGTGSLRSDVGIDQRADASSTSPICTDFFNNNSSQPGPICSPPDKFGRCMWAVDQALVIVDSPGNDEICISKINLGFVGTVPATPHQTSTVRYSSDHGANFGSAINVVVDGVGVVNGFDVQHNGTVSIAAGALKTRKATTLGGAYSDDQSWDTNPGCVEFPWSRRNSTTLDNTGSSPDYIVGLLTPDSSSHTWYWVNNGVKVNITPVIGGNPGIPVGPDCVTTYLGKYIAMLASFAGTTHLVTSTDAGSTWTDRGAVNATYIRVQRLASQPGKFYAVGSVFDFTSTFGAKLISKSKPGTLLFFEGYY